MVHVSNLVAPETEQETDPLTGRECELNGSSQHFSLIGNWTFEMSYRKRIKCTAEQKQDIQDRWKRGETMHEIRSSFDRFHTTVFGLLSASGGIRPPDGAVRRMRTGLRFSRTSRC